MQITRQITKHDNEAAWLEARKSDITSTEVAALFGCSPYLTAYELFHRKTGAIDAAFEVNERMEVGQVIEPAIAALASRRLGIELVPFKEYARIPEVRAGASFDYRSTSGDLIVECKNVDGLEFKRKWLTEFDNIEAPPHIELQVQAQMEVADVDRCVIAALVGGNELKIIERERDREIGAMILAKIADFWKRIADGNPPPPDFEQDAATIAMIYGSTCEATADLTNDARAWHLCSEYKQAAADEDSAKKRKEAAKAELLTLIGDASKAITTGYTISAGMVAESKGTLVTPEMVGTYVGGRKSYRLVRITAAKASKEAA